MSSSNGRGRVSGPLNDSLVKRPEVESPPPNEAYWSANGSAAKAKDTGQLDESHTRKAYFKGLPRSQTSGSSSSTGLSEFGS